MLLSILIVDASTKSYAASRLPEMRYASWSFPYGGVGVFEDLFGIEFSIVHATNTGMAWSLLAHSPDLLLFVRGILIAAIFGYLLFFTPPLCYLLPLSCILAGALGNVIDFFFYRHVVDLFYFVFWGYSYPVFNVADIAITSGALALCFAGWKKR